MTTYSELRGRLIAEMETSPAKMREGHEALQGLENSLKVYMGLEEGSRRSGVQLAQLTAAEADLKAKCRQPLRQSVGRHRGGGQGQP